MPDTSSPRAPARELLLANHRFPGQYTLKAFGPGNADFREAVVACAAEQLGRERVVVRERATASGHKVCVTLELSLDTVDQLMSIYTRIHLIPGLFLVL